MITLFNKSDLSGVICMESASRFNNLSTFPEFPLMIFQETSKDRDFGYMRIYSQEKLDKRYTTKIRGELYLTIPERTIVDMVRFEHEERFIYESLNKFISNDGNITSLLNIAEVYQCMPKVMAYVGSIDEWVKFFYNHEG